MGQTAVVTVRIKREIKDALEKAGVNIPSVIRQHLEELTWRLQLKEETEKMRKLLEDVKPSEREFSVKSVKEDRESH